MAHLGYRANPETDAEGHRGPFEVIPPGWHKVVIIGSEVKPTKANNGKLLELKYELQDESGRTLTDRLNIVNPSETAQRIGRGALAKIALAVGHKGELLNTNVLHGRPFEAKVEIEEFESNNEPGKMLKSNKISDYRPAQAFSQSAEVAKQPVVVGGAAKAPTAW